MRRGLFCWILATAALTGLAEPVRFGDGKGLFNRRLGMFVHWGIYAVDGYHEQQWMRRRMPKADYVTRAGRFTAKDFDPDRWIDVAEAAGAEYIVFTAKHHDGFCLWDTATTDFKVTNTPARRKLSPERRSEGGRPGERKRRDQNGVVSGRFSSGVERTYGRSENEQYAA